MNEGQAGIAILAGITLISSLVWHFFCREFGKAIAGATITSVAMFQIAVYFHSGYIDPFIWIAVVMSSLCAFVGSIGIGAIFMYFRKKSSRSSHPTGADSR